MTVSTGSSPRPRDAPGQDVPECPYVGLVPFNEKDAEYFFGRERESELIVANLTTSRLTLLYAPSGVGKTSVLRAGVLPRLRRIGDDFYAELDVSGPAVVYVRSWRDNLLESIAAIIIEEISRVNGTGVVENTASAPVFSAAWLREVLHQSGVSVVYLIFDQFEEYFLYHPIDRGEKNLTTELGNILSDRDLPVHVLLSIREDALASLDRFKGRVPNLFDNYFRLAYLSRSAAQTAIEGPLEHYNHVVPDGQKMSIERELIDALLDQVRTGQVHMTPEDTASDRFASDRAGSDGRGDIETPYLQLVLIRLWDQERATGSSSLRLSTLNDLGGAQRIVQTHFDNVMTGLSSAQVDVAAKVFRYLITASGMKIALPAKDLAEYTGLPVNVVQDLLEALCSGHRRILRPVPPAVGIAGPTHYEIFHDVMGIAVREWRRRYVAQQQQDEASRQLNAEREKARAAAQAARRRFRQRLVVVLTVMVLLVGVLGVMTYQSRRNAQQRAALAQAAATLSYNPVESLKHAVDAYQIDTDEQARSAVLTAASNPRNQVVAGPVGSKPMTVIGMVSTPDSRHVVLYDANGHTRVVGDNGAVEREQVVSDLRGTVTPVASTISTPAVSTAAVAPDASRVALGTGQGTVAVIDTATGRSTKIDSAEGSTPTIVRWIGPAANGLILVVFRSGLAATYSPDTGKQLTRFPDKVYDALPLADGQRIVTSGWDGRLRVWDTQTVNKVAESPLLNAQALRRYEQSVVSFSVGESADKSSIVVWNWQAGPDAVARYPVNKLNGVRQFVVDEHAQIVITSQDKRIQTFNLVEGSAPSSGSLPTQAGLVNNVVISADGQWVATAGADGRVLVWLLAAHELSPSGPTYELFGHRGEVTQVSYLKAGTVVMSLGVDGTVRRWELPPIPRFEGHNSWVVGMDLSRDGSWLATAGQDGRAFILDPHKLRETPAATVLVGTPLRAVRFDPAAPHHILTLGHTDRIPGSWSWSSDGTSAPLQDYESPPMPQFGYLVSIAISPDGRTVAGGDTSGTIHLWDARTGKLRTDRPFPSTGQPATSIAFDPTGQLLATTDSSGVRLWPMDTTEPPTLLPYATSVSFDPSGDHLSTTGDGMVKIWTRRGTLEHVLAAHGYLSSSLSFSTDGGLLAAGTAEGLVEVWDVHSEIALMLDRHHGASVNAVQFLPGDRSTLISASDDGTVAQFRCAACTDPDRVIGEAVEWVSDNR